ncbi:hypothetical protein [Microtetraspora malaysiensis]|uniref:hypothetical protein n=1 Tax=Microtetraspora malaysiensis TaxID=161358 RepID=UPI000835C60A|nr:hypothetical protein [Microtetraspora malaysiensis]
MVVVPSPTVLPNQGDSGWAIATSIATVVAVVVALGTTVATLRRGTADRQDAEKRRRNDFLIQQLQGAADLYAEYKASGREFRFTAQDPSSRHAERIAAHRLRAYIAPIPSPYASLLKTEMFGTSMTNKATLILDEATLQEARRRAPDPDGDGVGPIDDEQIYREIADNIDELLGREGTPDG